MLVDPSNPRFLLPAAAAFLLTWGAEPAAASHQRGIRVTVTSVNSATLTVDVDVTAYTNFEETPYPPDSEEYLDIGAESEEANESPAISWGEGEALPTAELAFVSAEGEVATWRRSFSHTYSAPGTYTIRARSDVSGGEFEEMSESEPSENATPGPAYTGIPYSEYGGPFESETQREESGNPAFFVAFADVEFLQSVLEIPTASTVGLGLLSVLLASAGFCLLRR